MIAAIQDIANSHFDFIVVGGGASGLTLATRLVENSNRTVLVLEAGAELANDPNILIPGASFRVLGDVKYSYIFQTTKQPHANDKVQVWQRGKGLGGSSATNFMVYTTPPAQDLDDFERLGNPGFNWDNMRGALRKLEGFVHPREENLAKGNLRAGKWSLGTEGPLRLSFPPTVTILESKVQEALMNAGVRSALDPHGGDPHGFFITPNNYDPIAHARSYPRTAFYEPNRHRPNLTVLTSCQVQRIIITKTSNGLVSATGVEFESDGGKYVVHNSKEVILSAGTLLSPQLLELSGIGDQSILEKIGVPVQVHLPGVGANVQEHGMIAESYELKDEVVAETFDALLDPIQAAKHLELYASGTGLFTQGIIGFSFLTLGDISSNGTEFIKSIRESILSKWDSYSPSLQYQYKVQLDRLERSLECEVATYPGLTSLAATTPGKRHVSLSGLLMHPFSRGTIHSISNKLSIPPEFDPHTFEEEVDLQIVVEMVRFMKKLGTLEPLKGICARELVPGPEVETEEQIKDYVKSTFTTSWHTSSSCSMLPRDKDGVVNSTFKVYGTANLRVVDLSVMPIQICGHTQATAYAIGAYASEVILKTSA